MSYQVGVDIGGTFTDCVVMGEQRVGIGKALTTREDLSEGFWAALEVAADACGNSAAQVLADTEFIFHGTTVGTNAMIQRDGAVTGLLTTMGTGDSILIMRAHGRVAGLPIEEITRPSRTFLPEPLVPRCLIAEVQERLDRTGSEVVALDEDGVAVAVERLVARGVEAIAISYLWSFINPAHEERTEELIRNGWPDLYVSRSSRLVGKWGEYERTAATAVNGYVGPVLATYLHKLQHDLEAREYTDSLLILQASGGAMTPEVATASALLTIDSGPAAGLNGSVDLAERLAQREVICTDMGGTSFDVGLIVGGEARQSSSTVLGQYEYLVPKLDIRSVGAGGGSFLWVDDVSQTLKVGPQSAGANPGPVCYDRGGTEPTITDADVVLGYINPDYFLGGRAKLNRMAAEKALRGIGGRIGLSAVEVAAGANRIIDSRMADLIRQMTVQQGHDPRDFTVFAYGGAGGVHAGSYSRELRATTVVVPSGELASVWSAFGAARANISSIFEQTDLQASPFMTSRVEGTFRRLEARARTMMRQQGVPPDRELLVRSVDMRYRGQVFEIRLPFEEGPISSEMLDRLNAAFEDRYEELYSRGAAFAGAGTELVNFRIEAYGLVPKVDLQVVEEGSSEAPSSARATPREVYWPDHASWEETPVFWGQHLLPGNVVTGPAVIDLPGTAVVVHPSQVATVDKFFNVVVRLPQMNEVN